MKKILSFLLIPCLILTLTSGCKNTPDNADHTGDDTEEISYPVISKDPSEYKGFEFVRELTFDHGIAASISDNGKYILIIEKDDKNPIFHVYEHDGFDYKFLKSILLPQHKFIYRIDGTCIVWSHDNEKFAFYIPRAIKDAQTSDIFYCDIIGGNIQNLTGYKGKEEGTAIKGTFCCDYLSAWGKNDRLIYFARLASTKTGLCAGIYAVDIATKDVKEIHTFPQDPSGLIIPLPDMFYRQGAFYYSVSTNSPTQDIFQYKDGRESLLHTHPKNIFQLVVSPDGENIYYNTILSDCYYFNINTPKNIITLKPTSSTGAMRNAIFSPDGKALLQIEYSTAENTTYLSIIDLTRPNTEPRVVYTVNGQPFFGDISQPINFHQLRPKWLSNGFIALNGEKNPVLLEAK